jgi:hypothetical protein
LALLSFLSLAPRQRNWEGAYPKSCSIWMHIKWLQNKPSYIAARRNYPEMAADSPGEGAIKFRGVQPQTARP